MVVDIPEKKHQWARAGLLSSKPVIVLDERIADISASLTIGVDPQRTTGLIVMLNGNKLADMWRQSMAGAISLVKAAEGDAGGPYILTLRTGNGPYGVWERPIPADWIEKSWNGTLVIEFGNRWMAVHLPDGPSVRGTGFVTGKGYAAYATIYSNPAKPYGSARLTLRSVTTRWNAPDGMTAGQRWVYVDAEEFDPEGFIVDTMKEIPEGEGGVSLPGGIVDELISVPTVKPAKLPEIAPAEDPRKEGALDLLHRFAAILNPVSTAYAAEKDCGAAIDAHLDNMRLIEVSLVEQPDMLKSVLSLGETILGSGTFSKGSSAETMRAQLSRALTAMHDGIAIGEDWQAGDDTSGAIHLVQAVLNAGLSSESLQADRAFSASVEKSARETWAKVVKTMEPKSRALAFIGEAVKKFNPGGNLDPEGVYKEILEKGAGFDFGAVFGAGTAATGDTRADVSAALWTLTNNGLATFSPHYKIAKAVVDTMADTANAAKAVVVNDAVRGMYENYKEEMIKHGGIEERAFFDAMTIKKSRLPLGEMKTMLRQSPDEVVDDEVATRRLFKLFDKWYAAEQAATKKSDRLSSLRDRFGALGTSCRNALERTTWPDRRSTAAKAWQDLTASGNYTDRAVNTWNNYWNSCLPEIELLKKYAELEAKTRASYLYWMNADNACIQDGGLEADVDRLICRLIDSGEDAYRQLMKSRLTECGAIKEPDEATKKARADHVFDQLVRINHDRLLQVLDELGVKPSEKFYTCLCVRARYGSSGTSQFYHPQQLGDYNALYACNHDGDPCVVSGGGCTRHPLPSDREYLANLHRLQQDRHEDGSRRQARSQFGNTSRHLDRGEAARGADRPIGLLLLRNRARLDIEAQGRKCTAAMAGHPRLQGVVHQRSVRGSAVALCRQGRPSPVQGGRDSGLERGSGKQDIPDAWIGDRRQQSVSRERIDERRQFAMGRLRHGAEQLARLRLRLLAVGGKAAAARLCEELVEDQRQVALRRPAVTIVEGEADAIAAIDLREQEGVERLLDQAADDARILHRGIEEADAGAAAADHQIDTAGAEQQPGDEAGVDVGQLGRLAALLHAAVDHLVAAAVERARSRRRCGCRHWFR